MKNKMVLLIVYIISIFTLGIVHASNLELLGKVIYLDPGHGGKDPGALSGNIRESDLNLKISLKLAEELEKKGAIVYLTRYGDYDLSSNNVTLRKRSDLSNRAKIINESKADLYLSIHLNADPSPTWKGAQVFYNSVNQNNALLAEKIQEQLKKDLNTNRDFKELKNQYMYKLIKVDGVLIEVGFITNSQDRNNLSNESYQIKLSKSITEGIINYFK